MSVRYKPRVVGFRGESHLQGRSIRPCPQGKAWHLLSLVLDILLGFREPGSVTPWRSRNKAEPTRLPQGRQKL